MRIEDGIEGGWQGDAESPECRRWLATLVQEVELIPLGILIRPVWAFCESEQEAEEWRKEAAEDGEFEIAARYGVEGAWFFGVSSFLREWQPTGMAS